MMKKSTLIALFTIWVGMAGSSIAAEGLVLSVMAGFATPYRLSVAPGELITITLTGLNVPQQPINAGSGTLPLTLGGISARLTVYPQEIYANPEYFDAPVLSVFPVANCVEPAPCHTVTGVTIQFPYGIPPDSQGLAGGDSGPGRPPSILTFSDSQGRTAAANVFVLRDQVSIVNTGQGFGPAVTHADGTMVSDTPAQPGETLVMYALGLGEVSPPVPTGALAPSSPLSKVTGQFELNFEFGVNASPSTGGLYPGFGPTPVFAGLAPGFAGLYQVNFVVPRPPLGTPPCSDGVTNFTVTLVGVYPYLGNRSYDGAQICVAVPGEKAHVAAPPLTRPNRISQSSWG